MAVPKRKVSPSRAGMRRSHQALGANSYVEDKETGELRRPHHVDLKTGMYNGRQVITPKADEFSPFARLRYVAVALARLINQRRVR